MKKFLVTIAVLGFAFSAQAEEKEIQINGAFAGTSGGYSINDNGTNSTNVLNLNAAVYHSMNANFQIGGAFSVTDSNRSDLTIGLGVLARYNLDTELRDSMFFDLGLAAGDVEEVGDTLALNVGFGKRYALSDNVTWTPNVSYTMPLDSDQDGYVFSINVLSFSGFM